MNNNKSFIAFSFSKGFTSPNLPIATFYQGDKELNFVIDTGSDDNVISNDTLKDIEYTEVEHNGILAGLGGIKNVKACNITFSFEKDEFTTKFLISDSLKEAFNAIKEAHGIPLHGMLGSKFLKENNIVLDFVNMLAYNKEG